MGCTSSLVETQETQEHQREVQQVDHVRQNPFPDWVVDGITCLIHHGDHGMFDEMGFQCESKVSPKVSNRDTRRRTRVFHRDNRVINRIASSFAESICPQCNCSSITVKYNPYVKRVQWNCNQCTSYLYFKHWKGSVNICI